MSTTVGLSPNASAQHPSHEGGADAREDRIAFPLSFAQARLWVLDRFNPGNPAYNIPAAMPLKGWLDHRALERSLNEIVRRHDVLRTTFEMIDRKPAQVVAPSLKIKLESVELRFRSIAARDAEVNRIVIEEGRRPFDLSKGPLVRALLLKLGYADHILVIVMHHIVSDGWSMTVFCQELSTLYMAFLRGQRSPLPELPIQYADFAEWQADWLRGEVLEQQLGYWRKQLAGLRPVLDLPTDRPRPPAQTNRGDGREFALDRALCEDLKKISQSRRATLFIVLLAAFKSLLFRLCDETDVAVGSPIANRTRSELEGLIGFFVNTLVLRTDLSGDPSFVEMLAREREVALGAYAHQDMPFEKLVEEMQPERNLSHNPLFQIMFAVQNIGTVERNGRQAPASNTLPASNGTAKFDLTLSLLDTGAGAQGFIEFNTDLYDASTAEMIIRRYQSLLRGVVQNPDCRLSSLPILLAGEREQLLTVLANVEIEAPHLETIGDSVSLHAATTPEAAAAIAEGGELSYAELNRRANRFARRLRTAGVTAGGLVAVAMASGFDALIAITGILKTGCAYLPIDLSELAVPNGHPGQLPRRVERMLADANPELVVVDELTKSGFPVGVSRVLRFEELQAGSEMENDSEPEARVNPDSIAFVVYQAAADGTVHRIALTHRTLRHTACHPETKLNSSDRVAHLSHSGSSSACLEIFGSLAAGAAIVYMPEGLAEGPRRFAGKLRDLGVTVMFARATTVERLAREFPWALRKMRLLLLDERLTDWRRLSEVLKQEILARMRSLYGDPLIGGFFAVQSLDSLPVAASTIPMGSPTPGVAIHVLDRNMEPVPTGVPGDVYLESAVLLGDSKHPTSAMVPSPFSNGVNTFLYKTNDIARRLKDGSLVYRGRRDGRLMTAGVMAHPAEIELVLREHPAVREAAVVARRGSGLVDRGLIAFVATAGNGTTDRGLRDFLAQRLPDHLIPTAVIAMETLPRAGDGGVDRRVLTEAADEIGSSRTAPEPYVAPRNEIETELAYIWMETLGADRIGVKDNFFRLGGHSLIATQSIARINDAFQIDLPLQQLFEAPTIEAVAKVIAPLVDSNYKSQVQPIALMPRDKPLPLSFSQQRLWFLDQFEPDSAFYNIAIPVRLPGYMDVGALEAALNDLIERHETLRTSFGVMGDQPAQVIAPSLRISMPVHDLRKLPESERHREAERLAELEAQRPFNLKTGPVLRAELVRLSDSDQVLLFTIHHIAADGWSTEIIFRELFVFYEARITRRSADLPELQIQYADFACWQRKRLSGVTLERQLAYWREQLDGAPALLELPTDRPRPRVQMFRGGMHRFSIPLSLLESLKRLTEREETTLFTTLLAGFNVLLYRYTSQEDLLVGSPIANRTRPELERLIGFFANTLVLRTHVSGDLTFQQMIARQREVTLRAYAHQDVPFEKLVEEFQPERSLSYNPLFQVMFALQNTGRPASVTREQDQNLGAPVIGAGVAKFDLTMFVSETTNGLYAGIEYNSDLFDASTIARLAGHYETLLAAASDDPGRPVWMLPMISLDESILLAECDDTLAPFEHVCAHRMLEVQVERTPDATAIVFDDQTVSYRMLDRRANYWAHRLVGLGVRADACVGVLMERSPDIIVAIVAILKAGAAYLPLDPNYPKERIAFMLADSQALTLFTEGRLCDGLPSTTHVLTIESGGPNACRDDSPLSDASAGNLAYVMYTSGSTGKPKGVAMPHAPLVNLIQWQIARSDLPPGARTLQFASLSFDVSFQEIFSTLCCAGSLVLVGEEQRRDPNALWGVLRAAQVNRLFLPYVALQQLADHAKKLATLPCSLVEVIAAGEQLQITPQIVSLFERLEATLYNQYGPTECHVVTELKLSPPPLDWPARPDLGRPIQNVVTRILDPFGQPCPIGIPGELHLGGEAPARCYLHREELTAERFISDSHRDGGRLYRTGDRARYLANGNIEFLGRMDDQVKIRGFRVEPGEIEASLRKHHLVQEAVVVARQQGAGDLRLVAYVQADPKETPSADQLRSLLSPILPEYMIPSAFVVMGTLPLTPSGKIDRRALPRPEPPRAERAAAVTPRTPIEEALASIWREVLQVPHVGVHNNFFELGGHSLLATRVISRIRDEFLVELPVRRMFEAATIEMLALSVIEATLQAQSDDETALLLAEIEQMPDDEAQAVFSRY